MRRKLVTVATSHRGRTALLFNDDLNEEFVDNLIDNDDLWRIFKGQIVITQTNHDVDTPCVVVESADSLNHIVCPERPNENKDVVVAERGRVIDLDLNEIYLQCTKPEKLILGCDDCLSKGIVQASSDDCLVLRISDDSRNDVEDPEDINEAFKKGSLAGYKYVSPVMTGRGVVEAIRNKREHDFTMYDRNVGYRSSGAKTRSERARLRKEKCTKCAFKDTCHKGFHTSKVNWCDGPYNVKDSVDSILGSVNIPFTGTQIRTLLRISGELPKRYKRYRCVGTFKLLRQGRVKPTLCFVISAWHGGLMEEVSYKRALELFGEKEREEDRGSMDRERKAVLVCLARHSYSPTYNNGWAKTSYETVYISDYNYTRDGSLEMFFKHGSGSKLPWSVAVNQLEGIFANYGNLRI
jgi:hypothetical protein